MPENAAPRPPMADGFPMTKVGTLEITRLPDADLYALMIGATDAANRICRAWQIVRHLPPDAIDGQAEHLKAELIACMNDVQRLPDHVVRYVEKPLADEA